MESNIVDRAIGKPSSPINLVLLAAAAVVRSYDYSGWEYDTAGGHMGRPWRHSYVLRTVHRRPTTYCAQHASEATAYADESAAVPLPHAGWREPEDSRREAGDGNRDQRPIGPRSERYAWTGCMNVGGNEANERVLAETETDTAAASPAHGAMDATVRVAHVESHHQSSMAPWIQWVAATAHGQTGRRQVPSGRTEGGAEEVDRCRKDPVAGLSGTGG